MALGGDSRFASGGIAQSYSHASVRARGEHATFLAMPPVVTNAIFWIFVATCAVAQLFILRAVLRVVVLPRTADTTENSGIPAPRRSLEILWAVLPALFLGFAFIAAWRVMHPTS